MRDNSPVRDSNNVRLRGFRLVFRKEGRAWGETYMCGAAEQMKLNKLSPTLRHVAVPYRQNTLYTPSETTWGGGEAGEGQGSIRAAKKM